MCRGRRTIAFVLVGKWGKILNHKTVLDFVEILIGHFQRVGCLIVCWFINFCVCGCVRTCVFRITYVPAEYVEEYKASLEPTQDNVFSESAPAPKYVQ